DLHSLEPVALVTMARCIAAARAALPVMGFQRQLAADAESGAVADDPAVIEGDELAFAEVMLVSAQLRRRIGAVAAQRGIDLGGERADGGNVLRRGVAQDQFRPAGGGAPGAAPGGILAGGLAAGAGGGLEHGMVPVMDQATKQPARRQGRSGKNTDCLL